VVDRLYVIVDNHSVTDRLTGSYRASLRTQCAHEVTGTLSATTATPTGNLKTANVFYDLVDSYNGWQASSGTFTASETNPGGCNLQGSGPIETGPLPEVGVGAYCFPYTFLAYPYIGPSLNLLLGNETIPSVSGGACGDVPSPTLQAPEDCFGKYTDSNESGISFACSTSDPFYKTSWTDNGTLSASGVAPCGLWTRNCRIGS
jgi:hypothetical protein